MGAYTTQMLPLLRTVGDARHFIRSCYVYVNSGRCIVSPAHCSTDCLLLHCHSAAGYSYATSDQRLCCALLGGGGGGRVDRYAPRRAEPRRLLENSADRRTYWARWARRTPSLTTAAVLSISVQSYGYVVSFCLIIYTMSSSEDEDLFLFCLLQSEEEKRQKTMWVHPINENRKKYGEFHLFPDLLKDKRKFFQYFRMSPEKFYELLNMLRPFIEKQDTYFRPVQTRPVSPEERLAVCLRCMDSYWIHQVKQQTVPLVPLGIVPSDQ
ncbi:hypothetical protein J6590_099128 [Homalodisca vitripennis]|nr:hypothetical protein J6590_099128 [Homalodisca vitripennis]